ncbi:MAG: esterase [Flavobacteriaceae bacterium]
MKQQEKQVDYQTTNTYTTLNTLSNTTKNVWIVFHGIGYLSTYFLKYFDELPPEENYIIAPQAPSKYYLNKTYRHVGASWLTKENTISETENIISYLEAVYKAENINQDYNLIIFGFSQGVSIATRWVARKQLKCDQLVLYAGGLPNELRVDDFIFLEANTTEVTILVGNTDKYLTEERRQTESEKINALFHGRAKQLVFDGGHEIKKALINTLV